MSLSIYKHKHKHMLVDIEVEWENDTYFDKHTEILDSPIVLDILRDIEHAEFVSANTFRSLTYPEFGMVDKKYLSLSTKTLLNVIAHPEVCFYVGGLKGTAYTKLLALEQGKALCTNNLIEAEDTVVCDILVNGKYKCSNIALLVKLLREMPYEFPEEMSVL